MNTNLITTLASIAIILPAFLVALSFHEFAHALTATLLGDDTPKKMGRLTLNPIAHIDFLGLFFLLIFRFGWAKPVTFNQRNFKFPRFYSIITALAGPFSNFLIAVICLYGMHYLPVAILSKPLTLTLQQILFATARINIMLGTFNILPIPPLDGSHILMAFLVNKYPKVAAYIYRYSLFILLGIFIIPQTKILLIQAINFVQILLTKLVI